MLKKVMIGVLVVVVVGVGALFYLNSRQRTLSPPGKAELTSAGITVTIPYSRPSVRGRMIFGAAEAGALQPYGHYWRMGANEATEITFSKDVNFNGSPVNAGTYRIYAVPGPDSFDIFLNTETGEWGYSEADHGKDVAKTTVAVEKLTSPVEQHTIRLEPLDNGMTLIVEFEQVRLSLPVTN
jgi:hypothetical protein